MVPLQDKPQESRVYRYSISSVVDYLVRGAVAVAAGCIFLARVSESFDPKALLYWIAVMGCFLLAIYFAATAAYSVVIFSRDSITVRGVFGTRSIRKSSVKGYENSGSGRNPSIRLVSNSSEETDLSIFKNYAFDEEWRNWLSSFPDPDIADEARFTLK
jgi:hypothetical protein